MAVSSLTDRGVSKFFVVVSMKMTGLVSLNTYNFQERPIMKATQRTWRAWLVLIALIIPRVIRRLEPSHQHFANTGVSPM